MKLQERTRYRLKQTTMLKGNQKEDRPSDSIKQTHLNEKTEKGIDTIDKCPKTLLGNPLNKTRIKGKKL